MEEAARFSGCTLSYHQCRCFEKLSDEQRTFLNANSVTINYRKGEMICKQGGFVSHVMYMERGLAKVFLENGSNSLVLRITPDRNFLGLSSVSEEHSYFPYSAMAYIDSEIRQIEVNAQMNRPVFRHFIGLNFKLLRCVKQTGFVVTTDTGLGAGGLHLLLQPRGHIGFGVISCVAVNKRAADTQV